MNFSVSVYVQFLLKVSLKNPTFTTKSTHREIIQSVNQTNLI